MDKGTQIVFIVFTAIMLVSVLIELGAIIAILLAAKKTEKKVQALAADFRTHVLPSLNSSRALVEDLSPKLKVITSNLLESSHSVRNMAGEVSSVVADVAERTRVQAANVDGMFQGTLDQVNRAGDTLRNGISAPLRELQAILNGLRAGFHVLWNDVPPRAIEFPAVSPSAPEYTAASPGASPTASTDALKERIR